MPSLSTLPPLRDVIARHDLMARKSLGQHFLCDLNLTAAIADAAGDVSGCTVFEIGPGPGGLTRALVATDAAKIIAIEKDRRCLPALAEIAALAEGRLDVIEGDALKTDVTQLAPAPRAIIANLPYNIGTELLLGWLRQIAATPIDAPVFQSLTLMFQAEVVDRLTASPNSKAYGRLSVITQFFCQIERKLDIPASAFTPPPKINSAVARLSPRRERANDITFDMLGRVTAAAFGQRRKMLRSSLKSLGGTTLLQKASIDPERRAETLSLHEFETLARLVSQS